jgi:acyl-coenzyme A thioesterase PaaI-like protein
MLRLMVPYSGSIRPAVRELAAGRAKVFLKDRRRVRNHLTSIHAVALANLGELTTGLAVVTALPPSVRSILVGLNIVYHKKARGTLMAECHACPPTPAGEGLDYTATTNIQTQGGETVCEVRAQWRLSPPASP